MPTRLAHLLVIFVGTTVAIAPVTPAASAPVPSDRSAAAAPPALQPEQPGEPADAASRSAAARKHYAARQYPEAARLYEQLYRDTKAAKYLFNAGMARAAAAHDGAAILHWTAYLATPNISASERSMLAGEIAAARRRTLPIELRVQGPLAPATLSLHAPDSASQGPRDPIDLIPATAIDLSLEPGDWVATLRRPDRAVVVAQFRVAPDAEPVIAFGADMPAAPAEPAPTQPPPTVPADLTIHLGPPRALARGATVTLTGPEPRKLHVRDPSTSWKLPPGAWDIRVVAPDHAPATASARLGAGEARTLRLDLRRDRAGQVRLGLGLGLGGAGLVFLTAGAVVAARAPHQNLPCSDAATCRSSADAVLDRSIGFALIGTGLGAAVPALTAGLVRRPDRALQVEAGVGGALLVGGLAWYVSEASKTTALDHTAREHTAATVLGLGGGLLGGAAIALLVRHLTRSRTNTAVSIAPQPRGLALQTRF